MGQRKASRARFFDQHPICCFCGGARHATEQDHIPSRGIFRGREWPEEYVFPACSPCNGSTRQEEGGIAFLSRIYPDPVTPEDCREFENTVQGLKRNFPELLDELEASREEVEKAKEAYELSDQESAQLVTTGPLVERCIQRFGLRLTCALYYMHAKRILPEQAGVAVRFFTNLNVFKGEVPSSLPGLLANAPTLQRNGKGLGDQFSYKFGLSEDGGAGAFLCGFRQSFAIFSIAYEDRSKIPTVPEMQILRPGRF